MGVGVVVQVVTWEIWRYRYRRARDGPSSVIHTSMILFSHLEPRPSASPLFLPLFFFFFFFLFKTTSKILAPMG